MVKNVNVTAKYPVYNVLKTPIIGKLVNIRLADNQIYACLAGNAKVEEILSDGSTLLLNAHNYNKVNTPKTTVEKNKKEEELAKAAEAKRLAEEAAKQKEAQEKAEAERAKKLAEEEAARKAAEEKRKAEEAKRLAEKEAAEKAQKEAQEKAEAEKKASEETADKEDTTSKNNNTNKGKK